MDTIPPNAMPPSADAINWIVGECNLAFYLILTSAVELNQNLNICNWIALCHKEFFHHVRYETFFVCSLWKYDGIVKEGGIVFTLNVHLQVREHTKFNKAVFYGCILAYWR